jgi:TonB family protein
MRKYIKYILIIFFSIVSLNGYTQKKDRIVMPEFPGGTSKLHDYLLKETNYPIEARKNNEIGEVIVAFSIETDGTVSGVRVIKSVSTALDNEAVRVVKSMPKWKPGKRNNKATRADLTIPINFRIMFQTDTYVDDEAESGGGIWKESARDKRNKVAGVKKL